MTELKKHKKIFIDGPIGAGFIADSIAKHSAKMNIGAHSIFLGQVRNDKIDEKEVAAIEYTSYQEMADEKIHEIREDAFKKYSIISSSICSSICPLNLFLTSCSVLFLYVMYLKTFVF